MLSRHLYHINTTLVPHLFGKEGCFPSECGLYVEDVWYECCTRYALALWLFSLCGGNVVLNSTKKTVVNGCLLLLYN